MRPIGFSTGALAYANFRKALEVLSETEIRVVELSALRDVELKPLIDAIDMLDLSQYEYISVHAPSSFKQDQESQIIDLLLPIVERKWPVIVHPDTIYDYMAWRSLGAGICVENMDNRKTIGRSALEMRAVFDCLPDAKFCFDIGHARQFDSTMTEAYLLLTAFKSKLCQVHVSEVNSHSKHDVLSYGSIRAFQEVADLIPVEVPLVLETPTNVNDLQNEIGRAYEALPALAAA